MSQLNECDGEHTEKIGPFEMCKTAAMLSTCVGSFYFGPEITDFVEFTLDLKNWDFNGAKDYDFTPILFQPTDKKMFKFMSQIIWDEVHHFAMFHLPMRFYHAFFDMDVTSEWAIIERLLLLAGDIETNPGPVQSRPLQYRYNDPRYVKLEKAIERRDQKIKTLVSHLRQQIKSHNTQVYAQMFGGVKNALRDTNDKAGELNQNLNRICDFLENSLPTIQANVQATLTHVADNATTIKEDLIKLTLLIVIVRLMMTWKHYKTALAIVLIFVLKYYGFDKIIIDMVLELKTKFETPTAQVTGEDIVYHPYFHTCGKLIFAFVAFICIKKIPGKRDWDTYITRLDRIPKSIDGAKKIVDYCSEYFNIANDQVKMMVLGKTREELRRANGLYEEIHEWAREVRHYLDLDERNKIDTDITIANRVEDLYKRGVKYQADTLLDREMARLVSTTLLPARELYQYVSCSPVKGGGPRMRPICLWLVGESGVGKTEMVYPLCIDVLRTMGLMKKEDFHHQVYGRQVETEFWDGYKGQKIVIYDDAFQMKDDKTSPNPEVFEVIRSCNTFPQHLHMAALHDKNTFSAAELMLYTTNDMNVKLESITFPDAFFNRIGENAYKVRPKLEYAIVVEKGNSGTHYRKLDKTKLDPTIPIDLSIYEFQKIQRDSSSEVEWIEVGEPIDYETFQKLICSQWREQKQRSIDKLKFLEQYAIRAQVAPEVFHDCAYDHDFFVNDIARGFCEGKDLISMEAEYALDDRIFAAYLQFKQTCKPTKWQTFKDRIDAVLRTTGDYLNKLKSEIIDIIRSHPYLSVLGFVSVALSAFAMYHWFEKSLNVNAEAEVGQSGDVKTNKQARRVVEVGNSGDVKTAKQVKTRVEIGGSGDAKTSKQPVARVESLDEKLLEVVTAQGCSDQAAHTLVTDVLQKNTYRLSYTRGEKRFSLGNCTFVRGWLFLMPYHFIEAIYARKISPESTINFSQSKCEDIIQIPVSHFIEGTSNGFELTSNCARMPSKNGEFRDCVAVNLHRRMCHPHRDLVRHFVKTEDQGKLVGKFNGTLATFHETQGELYRTYQWLQQIRPMDKKITIYYPEDGYEYPNESYVQRDCYEYNAPTQVGDCGSIIGLYNSRIERKLIGIHIAGTNEEYGYACPLTQEAIDNACEILLGKDFRNISAQFYYELPRNVDSTAEIVVPKGLFVPIGKATQKVGQATKTSIVKSCIHGELSEPFMRPALLRPTKINGVLHDPLLEGLKKCGVQTAVLPDDEVESAAQDVSQVVLGQYNSMLDRIKYQRILSYEEAIRGTQDDDFMCAINRTTSPGFPYSLETKSGPGKTHWMGNGEKFDFESPAAKKLRADVDELIENCRQGKISDVFFVDTLKDERRENAKVDVGKTRVFSAGPQHFVVAFRKYFLPFSAWLMHNRIDNEIGVGTNPYSLDWERIAKRLKAKGNRVVAGDFGNFDGSLVAQILWAIFWEIFVPWLGQFVDFATLEGQDILKICLGLWTHLVHSVHIFGDNVYMWTHSQPSGNPFTVIINCLYNSIIMRVVWIRIMKKKKPKYVSMKYFRLLVSMLAYGDDNELNIAEEIIDIFNQESISEEMLLIKHEYTDEAKTGNIVKSRTLEETCFLKRGFRFCPELQRTVAPLKIEVIYEMLNWTRNTIDPNVILMSNVDTAFREVVYHGREEYNKLRKGIMKIATKLPEIPQILTYEAYLHDAKYLADELYDF